MKLRKLFSSDGRLSRIGYISGLLRIFFGSLAAYILFGVITSVLAPSFNRNLHNAFFPFVVVSQLIVPFCACVLFFFFSIRRLHDLDMKGWFSLFLLIPILNIFMFLWLLIAPGIVGNNKYGVAPPNETKASKIINITVLSIIVVIIVGVPISFIYSMNQLIQSKRDIIRVDDLRVIQEGIKQYRGDNAKYPINTDHSLDKYITRFPRDPKEGQKNDRCTYGYKYEPIKSSTGSICGYHLSACMELEKNEKKGQVTENSECK